MPKVYGRKQCVDLSLNVAPKFMRLIHLLLHSFVLPSCELTTVSDNSVLKILTIILIKSLLIAIEPFSFPNFPS